MVSTHERKAELFEILIQDGRGRTDRDFSIETMTSEDRTARKVAGLNAAIERDNPREYAQGRRYYYRIAPS